MGADATVASVFYLFPPGHVETRRVGKSYGVQRMLLREIYGGKKHPLSDPRQLETRGSMPDADPLTQRHASHSQCASTLEMGHSPIFSNISALPPPRFHCPFFFFQFRKWNQWGQAEQKWAPLTNLLPEQLVGFKD